MRILIALLLLCLPLQAQDATTMIHEIMNPVVKVQLLASHGSGVIVYSQRVGESYRTFVLTNFHVVDDAVRTNKHGVEVRDDVRVMITKFEDEGRDYTECETNAYIVTYNKTLDTALLELTDRSLHFESVARLLPRDKKLGLFQKVWNVGHPGGQPLMFSHGLITLLGKRMHFGLYGTNADYIRTNSPIYFGNSGGGTFLEKDDQFYLIGMPTRIRIDNGRALPYVNYAVSITSIRKFLKEKDLGFIEAQTKNIPSHVRKIPNPQPVIEFDLQDAFEFIIPFGPPPPQLIPPRRP